MLPSLNGISTFQSSPTQDTMDKCNKLLDYASTQPNATIHYHASNMILMTGTYSAYLDLPEARSHIAGYYYFTNRMLNYSKSTPTPNVPILTVCKTLKTMVSSSYESETGGNFENEQNLIPLRHIIKKNYFHRQHIKGSLIITDNIKFQDILTRFIIP